MTIEEAKKVKRILEDIELMQDGPHKIRTLHVKGEHERIANIACELYGELQRHYETELHKFPSLKVG